MPRGAASHDYDAFGAQEALLVVDDARYGYMLAVETHASAQAVEQRLGLFEYLFEHEVGITALFELRDAHLQLADVDLRLDVLLGHDPQRLVAVDDRYFAVFEVDHLFCVFDYRRCVGGQIVEVVAYAYYQRRAAACGYDLVGVVLVYYGYGICADYLFRSLQYSLVERACVLLHDILYELHYDFGVGVAAERIAVSRKRLLYYGIILYRAVVDYGYVVRLRVVGMGVDVARLAVRRPARVGYADGAAGVLVFGIVFERRYLALALVHLQLPRVVYKCHSGAVVTTVFESVKSLNQYRVCFALTYITDDSTHASIFFS